MTNHILANCTISISDYKKDPMAVTELDGPVAVINDNQTAFYCITPELYEAMINQLEDLEMAKIIESRKEAAKHLAALGGTAPDMEFVPRRKP